MWEYFCQSREPLLLPRWRRVPSNLRSVANENFHSTATDDTKLWERETKTYTLILLYESENYSLFYFHVLSEFRY